MAREKIGTGEIYHVFNRGVDKRDTFLDSDEYAYFIHLLYVLNNTTSSTNFRRDFNSKTTNTSNEEGPTFFIREGGGKGNQDKRKTIVDVLAFVLMPNHYHLLLKQRKDGGISKFMQKLGTAYSMFFNKKHERSGSLFQGKYKYTHISSNSQLLYIPHYIHLNPLVLKKNKEKGELYLDSYKWSSYPDYVGIKNFPSVTSREFITSLFGGSNKYKKDLLKFVQNQNKLLHNLDQHDLIDYTE